MTVPKFDELEKARESLRQYEKNGLSKTGIINLDEGFGFLCEILTESTYTKEAKNIARNIAEKYINKVVIDVDSNFKLRIDIITCMTALNCCDDINNLIGISDSYKSLKDTIINHYDNSKKTVKETITYDEIAIGILTLSVEDQNKMIDVLCKDFLDKRILLNAINKISSGKVPKDHLVTGGNKQVTGTRNMKPRGCTVNGVHYENANDAVDALCRDGVIKKRDIPSSSFNAHLWLSTKQNSFGYTYKRDNY